MNNFGLYLRPTDGEEKKVTQTSISCLLKVASDGGYSKHLSLGSFPRNLLNFLRYYYNKIPKTVPILRSTAKWFRNEKSNQKEGD